MVKGRMRDEDAYKVIDVNLSFNENKRLLKELYKDKGLSIGDKRLRKLIKLKKSEINDSSSINHKMEKRPRKEKNNDFLGNGEKTSQVSSINPEMGKRPRLSKDCDNNTSFICSGDTILEKESSYDSGTKNDSEENTSDIDNIFGVEDEKVSCYEWNIELFDTEDKITYKTCLKDRNETTSEEIPVSAINDEFDQFQEELRIREKRLKNFVTFTVDDELLRLVEELNG